MVSYKKKLIALMEGLEIKNVSLFIRGAKIGDYRRLGQAYLKGSVILNIKNKEKENE